MRAAVCYEYDKPLIVEDIEIAAPHSGEVKVKIGATAICHSDIHFINGDLKAPLPFVPGHESAGIVDQVGEGVTTVKKGDRVVVSLLRSCGVCLYCRTGRPNLCEAKWPLDSESRLKNKKGQSVGHGIRVGSMAEYVMVDKSQLVKISEDMPLDRACLLACGVITGFGAVVNRARVQPMSSVVIIGVGGVGLNSIQGARVAGAYPIIAIDMLDAKLEAAKRFGATLTINGKASDPVQAVKDATGGRGADYVFVTVGVTSAVRQGLSMLGRRGMAVVVGLATQELTSNPMEYIDAEKTLTGSFMGSTNLDVDIPKLVELYKAGTLKLDELISQRFPLEKVNEAIASTRSGAALRNVLVF
jgi:S-(hydroxymethyl)glutathione dehydrogenase / alcohol dehydrogenase